MFFDQKGGSGKEELRHNICFTNSGLFSTTCCGPQSLRVTTFDPATGRFTTTPFPKPTSTTSASYTNDSATSYNSTTAQQGSSQSQFSPAATSFTPAFTAQNHSATTTFQGPSQARGSGSMDGQHSFNHSTPIKYLGTPSHGLQVGNSPSFGFPQENYSSVSFGQPLFEQTQQTLPQQIAQNRSTQGGNFQPRILRRRTASLPPSAFTTPTVHPHYVHPNMSQPSTAAIRRVTFDTPFISRKTGRASANETFPGCGNTPNMSRGWFADTSTLSSSSDEELAMSAFRMENSSGMGHCR